MKCYPACVSTAQEIDLVLNQIEETSNPKVGSRASNQFMLECLALIEERLPPLATEAAELINHYLSGRVKLDAVIECGRNAGVASRNAARQAKVILWKSTLSGL